MNHLLLGLCALLLSLWAVRIESVENIDTKEPIIKSSPALANNANDTGDFFGYSVVLHQVEESNDFESAIRNTRLIVGAPRGIFPGGIIFPGLPNNGTGVSENETGLVYQCPVQTAECGPLGWEGSSNPNDRRLFDNEPDGTNLFAAPGATSNGEQKDGQLMGQLLKSNGEFFLACAPRWIARGDMPGDVDNRRSIGRCFLSGRNLSDFVEIRPCFGDTQNSAFSYIGENRCSGGFGGTLSMVGSQTRVLLGAPGILRGRGALVSYNDASILPMTPARSGSVSTSDNSGFSPSVYDGWSLATGDFNGDNMDQGVVSGMPRHDSQLLYGRVNIRNLTSSFSNIRDPPILTGQQTGEFFGHAVETADLNGDGFDEVIVGAPMYSSATKDEIGRVFIFENTGNNFSNSDPIILNGFGDSGRFGHAIVNLGDVNGDNIDDIAVGAPYERTSIPNAVGVVYIYYGSRENVISRTASQSISSENLVGTSGLSLLTFGFSLGSQVDVDANGYRDLAIGAYESQNAVLLRTLSIAILELSMTTNKNTVTIRRDTMFTINLCATYSGRGLSGRPLEVTYRFNEVPQLLNGNLVPRVTGGSYSGTLSYSDVNTEDCSSNVINLANADDLPNGLDLRQPIVMQVTFDPIDRPDAPSSNQLTDFRDFPLIREAGNSTVSVTPTFACPTVNGTEVCEPDLVISLMDTSYLAENGSTGLNAIVATAVIAVRFQLRIMNSGSDPASSPSLNFELPDSFFTGATVISGGMMCVSFGDNGLSYTCPLPIIINGGDSVDVTLDWIVDSANVNGTEPNVDAVFTVALPTGTRDVDTDLANNVLSRSLDVTAMIDPNVRIVFPQDTTTYDDLPAPAFVQTISDIGEVVEINVNIGNLGISEITNTRLELNVPVGTPGRSFLYVGQLQPNSDEVTCSTDGVNPEGLIPEMMTTSRSRRRALARRQVSSGPGGLITVDCPFDTSNPQCFNFICEINNFRPEQSISLVLLAALDRRYYQNQTSDFDFTLYARLTVPENFAQFDTDPSNSMISATLRVTPVPDPPINIYLEIWLPILGGVLALILIILLFICCIYCGFFRKRRLEQAKKAAKGEFEVRQVPPESPAVVTGEDVKGEGEGEGEVYPMKGKMDEAEAIDIGDTLDLEEKGENPADPEKDPEETSL